MAAYRHVVSLSAFRLIPFRPVLPGKIADRIDEAVHYVRGQCAMRDIAIRLPIAGGYFMRREKLFRLQAESDKT